MDAILDYILRPDFQVFIISVLILSVYFAYRSYIEKKQRFVKQAFSQYISPEVVEKLIKEKRAKELMDIVFKDDEGEKTILKKDDDDEKRDEMRYQVDEDFPKDEKVKPDEPPSPEPTKTEAGDIKTDEPTPFEELLKKEMKPRTEYHKESPPAVYSKRGFNWYLLIRACISLAVLGAALYIIIEGRDSDKSSEWAYGAVGTVIGYWLK